MKDLMLKKNELQSTNGLELFGYIKCAECGCSDFKYKQELNIAGNQFGLYECLGCNSALVLDRDEKVKINRNYSQVLRNREQKRLI